MNAPARIRIPARLSTPMWSVQLDGCEVGYDIEDGEVGITHLDGREVGGAFVFLEDNTQPEDFQASMDGLIRHITRLLEA